MTHGTTQSKTRALARFFVGPIGRKKRRNILTADQSDARIAGIFSRRTNRTREAHALVGFSHRHVFIPLPGIEIIQ
eukprot:3798400-Pyramimonas_sp.AAC.1